MDKNQELTIQAFYDKWLKIGLCTEPADRPNAEWAVRWLYDQSEEKQPPIKWYPSPKAIGSEISDEAWSIEVLDSSFEGGYPKEERYAVESFRGLFRIVYESIATPIGVVLRANLRWSTFYQMPTNSPFAVGQHLAGTAGFLDYILNVCPNLQGEISHKGTLHGLIILAASAGWTYPGQDICHISERHNVLHLDEDNRLHCEDGMAVAYPDGFGVWAWHGTIVDEDIIKRDFSTDSIDNQVNIEVRRVMMEIYGVENYLTDSKAQLFHSDGFGELYKRVWAEDEPLVIVKVVNATPEPDGTYKDYFIRVPPNMETAEQAVAWTFDYGKGDYKPEKET